MEGRGRGLGVRGISTNKSPTSIKSVSDKTQSWKEVPPEPISLIGPLKNTLDYLSK